MFISFSFLFFIQFAFVASGFNDTKDEICGISSSPSGSSSGALLRIVGGSETKPGEFPWLVSLHYNGKHKCGGTIINERFVLTAAHCFTDAETPKRWRVVGGRNRLSETGEGVEKSISKIISHSNFSSLTNQNDIALVKTGSVLSLARICIPNSTLTLPVRTPLTVAGWGSQESDSFSSVDAMSRVDVYTYDTDRCALIYKIFVQNANVVPDKMMCASHLSGGKDSCHGDSGGPLMQKDPNSGRWTQVGVVSWGASCGRRFLAGVYTKISAYRPWIDETIEKNQGAKSMASTSILLIFALLTASLLI